MTTTTAYVTTLPPCDLCKQVDDDVLATVDGKTIYGPWANMCDRHFDLVGVGLGTGCGQRLIVGERPTVSREDKAAAIDVALASGDLDAIEDIVGDGDLAEYL